MKTCQREGCSNQVPKGRRDWCSGECRELARKPVAAPLEPVEVNTLELMQELRKAWKEVEKYRNKRQALIEAVYQAVDSNLKALTFTPVPKPQTFAPKASSKNEEVALPLFSDLQLGKVTPTYNSMVAEQRMEVYARKLVELTNLQRTHHPVRKVHVAALGDIIEGVLIFPGQAWLVDSGLYRQVTLDGPRIVVNFLKTLLANFEEVEVDWIIGNHGRLAMRGDYDPESNADRMLGRIVQMIFEASGEKRIKFNIPDGHGERHWYSVLQEGSYKALCIHGDQIRGGFAGFPFYGLGKKVGGWASGAIPDEFGDVLMGHFHQAASIPLNKRDVYVNGSPESYNTFAQEVLAAMSDPKQWLLFVNPREGQVTAEYKVRLT